jgi:hypothetical protein
MWHVPRTGEVHTGFGCENVKERDHLEDSCIDGRLICYGFLRNRMGSTWSGFIWLNIGTNGGLL